MKWLGPSFLPALLSLALVLPAGPGHAATKSIRAVMDANLTTLDPIATTAAITNMHASMVYDTLFALDETMTPQPLLVDHWDVTDDELRYTFTLRPGLKFSDGSPLTAEDCVASLKRWWTKDRSGQQLAEKTVSLTAEAPLTIRLVLREPWGQVLESFAKVGANYPGIMPARLARTDPNTPITDPTGSGPFMFKLDAWVPGTRAVYVKNPHYQSRTEPPSGMAGAREVKVDRVEWLAMADPNAAMIALMAGEVDVVQSPRADFLPTLKSASGVAVEPVGLFGQQGIVRLNHLQPPFDTPMMRQGVLHLVNQMDMLRATIGSPDLSRPCRAMFGCATQLASSVGAPATDPQQAIAQARALFAKAGYDGTPIVILDPADRADIHGAVTVLAQAMSAAGLRVDVQQVDLATQMTRRTNKGPPREGGWHVFVSYQTTLTASSPMNNLGVAAGCDKAWPGWPCDEVIERMRTDWTRVADPALRRRLAEQMQKRAYELVTYVPYGEWFLPVAYRADRLTRLQRVPINIVFWNVERR